MIRLAFFFSALFLAAVMDMRTRTIPDWLVVLVALTSMLPLGQPNLLGVLAGLPLLLAGITIGGIGGGDVKLMGACGLVLGASQALTGLFLALCLLVLWHAAGGHGQEKEQKETKRGEGTGTGIPACSVSFCRNADWYLDRRLKN